MRMLVGGRSLGRSPAINGHSRLARRFPESGRSEEGAFCFVDPAAAGAGHLSISRVTRATRRLSRDPTGGRYCHRQIAVIHKSRGERALREIRR